MSLNRAIWRDLGMPYRVIALRVKTRRVHAALTSTWVAIGAVAADNIGPSTTTEPYVVPGHPLVKTKSILTVGDSVPLATDPAKSYRLLGIPDGLGAFQSEGKTFTLLVNHELGPTQGSPHAHGFPGAVVSHWRIHRDTLEVLSGRDLATRVQVWDPASRSYVQGTGAWSHFCSADLAAPEAFFYSGLGTLHRLYLTGEETRPPYSADHGRAFAHIVTGPNQDQSWQLPRLGRYSFENAVASPHGKEKTIVVGLDDSDRSTSSSRVCTQQGQKGCTVPSELYVYVSAKQAQGNEIERAGLTNGQLYGLKVSVNDKPIAEENDVNGLDSTSFGGSGHFSLHQLGDVSGKSGIELQQQSINAGIMRFQRVEDGAWDPRSDHKNNFYFVTTASLTQNSRLWRLRFADIEHPELGGAIEILLTGSEGHKMLDNLTIDRLGRLLIQEDVGDDARLGKIWLYLIDTGHFIEVAQHNPRFFLNHGQAEFITQDEESSGIIEAEGILGKGWFLLDVQGHKAHPETALVEFGQVLAMFVDPRLDKEVK